MSNSNRFAKVFPLFYGFINKPIAIIIILFFLCFYTLYTLTYLNVALGIIPLAYTLICYKIEKKILNQFLFGPLTLISIFQLLGVGLGLGLYSMGAEGSVQPEITTIQLALIIGYPFQILGYWIFFRRVRFNLSISENIKQRLRKPGFFLLGFAVIQTIVSIATGAWDRTGTDISGGGGLGPAGVFTAFTLLSNLGYILFPLLLKNSSFRTKLSLWIILILTLGLGALTGSRGLVLFPIIYIFFGLWTFTRIKSAKIKQYLIIITIFAFVLIPFLNNYRSGESFLSKRGSDIGGKLEALSQSFSASPTSSNTDSLEITGAALYGKMSDINIYRKTPILIPHAGWDNWEAILYVFIPKTIYPNKPSIFDGHAIAVSYRDSYSGGIATISFNADLYRRFGWRGIIAGNLIFGLVYGFVISLFFNLYNRKPNTLHLLFVLLLFTFYVNTGTVLVTFWTWLYVFPKYLIALYVIYILLNVVFKRRKLRA